MPQNKKETSICGGCSLLCDDIDVSTKNVDAKGCEPGQAFFQIETGVAKHSVEGKEVNLESAISAAVNILRKSQAPLICGLDQLTMQSQVVAWKIAERIGATVDTTTSNLGRSSMFALQRTGKVTATLGEIASRSDLVVFWFCDPVTSHPRLLERISIGKRMVIVVDENKSETAKVADHFIRVDSSKAASLLAALKAFTSEVELGSDQLERTGVPEKELVQIFRAMKSAKYGSVFFGQSNPGSQFDLATDLMHGLVRRLNDVTRFVGQKLRTDSNAQSAEDVLAWSSGYPFAINYAKRFPRYNWLEHSTTTVLERCECDAILISSGADLQTVFGSLSRTAKTHLESIPKITLSPIAGFAGDVSFGVGVAGLDECGDMVRNDGIALPVNAIRDSQLDSTTEVLNSIFEKLSG